MRPKKRKSAVSGVGAATPPKPKRPAPTKLADLEPVAPPKSPKILVIDIETSPSEAWVWKIWEENVGLDQIRCDWTILSYGAKWVGKREEIYECTGGRGADKVRDDSILMPGLWNLMNEAEIIVAQNGLRFDIKKINWRLAKYEYAPYSPVRVIDTMVQAKRLFAATSNKLAYLSENLTDTPKSKHKKFPGFELWSECLKDNPLAWAEMRKYNLQDIRATEKLYLKQRPWIRNHPNVGAYDMRAGGVCPACGSPKLELEGNVTLQSGVYGRFKCRSCGSWSRGREMLNSLEVRKSKLVAC